MEKASSAKQERRDARSARTTEEVLSRLLSLKPGEIIVKSFFDDSESETVTTTPEAWVREALRCDDLAELLCAGQACEMAGQSMFDLRFEGVPGFFSDSQGSIYDWAFHHGAAECLRHLCKEGFECNDGVLLWIAGRLYGEIDDIAAGSINHLPTTIVVEAYLREMVRRYGVQFAKEHVAAAHGSSRWPCRRAIEIVDGIEDELIAVSEQAFASRS